MTVLVIVEVLLFTAILWVLCGCGTGPGGYAWGNAARGMAYGSQTLYGGCPMQPIYVQQAQPTPPNFTRFSAY